MSDKVDLNALFKIQYGIYVVSTKFSDKMNGQIATVVSQVTNEPNQVMVCLSKNTLTHELILKSGVFAVSGIDQNATLKFIGKFGFCSGRDYDKFADTNYEIDVTGVPMVTDNAIMILEANVDKTLDVGTHTIFVGKILSAKQLSDEAAMTYDYYRSELKGKTQANAPTYQKNI